MKILYLAQYYARPCDARGLRHYAHTKLWAEAGHEIVVIGARAQRRDSLPRDETVRLSEAATGSCYVRRVLVRPRSRAARGRIAEYVSYMGRAVAWAFLRGGRFDVVVASSPPLFAGAAGACLGRLLGIPYVLEVRDLWPRSAVVTGFLKSRLVISLARWLERRLYRRAAHVVCLTDGVAEGVREAGIAKGEISIVPNAVDEGLGADVAADCAELRKGETDRPVALYVGAHGMNNALDSIVEAAGAPGLEDVCFVLVGEGDQTERLRRKVSALGLANVEFVGRQRRDRVPGLLRRADVLLWPVLWNEESEETRLFKEGVLPNKLYDYLAAGRPIATSVPRTSEAAKLLDAYGAVAYGSPSGRGMASAVREALTIGPADADRVEAFVREHGRRSRASEMLAILEEVVKSEGRRRNAS